MSRTRERRKEEGRNGWMERWMSGHLLRGHRHLSPQVLEKDTCLFDFCLTLEYVRLLH